MKIISWNVNGLRAVTKKGFLPWFKQVKADIVGLQEIKALSSQLPSEILSIKGYYSYFNSAQRKGYSGVAIYTKQKPKKVITKLGLKRFDEEGRMLELIFPKFIFIDVYMPQGGREKQNLAYKLVAYDYLLKHLSRIKNKPVIIEGDFNVAHEEIDLARPKENKNNIVFTPEERKQIDRLLSLGFVDTFRFLYPKKQSYSWWSYRYNAREKNIGWRVDYVFISSSLKNKLKKSFILNKVYGSDHCPVGIII